MERTVRFHDVMAFVEAASDEAVRLVYQACAQKLSINTGGDSDEDVPKGMTNASDAMMMAMGSQQMPSRSSSLVSQLQKKVEEEGDLDDIAPPDLEVRLKCVGKNDQYKTTDFEVVGQDIKTRLAKAKEDCVRCGAHFPYGYGMGKDCLRISKCSGVAIGKTVDVTIRFYVWAKDGKKGITCYLKK